MSNLAKLRDAGLSVTVKNDGHHFIVYKAKQRFDLWPSSGLWVQNNDHQNQRRTGAEGLIEHLESIEGEPNEKPVVSNRRRRDKTAGAAVAEEVLRSLPADAIILWTDGSCGPKNPGWAGCGVAVHEDESKDEAVAIGWGTNNIAELMGVKEAVRIGRSIDPDRPLAIITDSQYVRGVVEQGWKAKKNQSLIAELIDLTWREKAVVHWVPGHCGIAGNERADDLAGQGKDRSEAAG